MTKAKSERVAFWVFIFFIVLFAAATVTIVIIAVEQTNSSLPEKIDVVIYRPPSGEASRLERYKHQARAVRENMSWVNQVFVLSASPVEGSDFKYVPFEGTQEEAFEFMPSVPNVQQYAVFLGDRTVPVSGSRSAKARFWAAVVCPGPSPPPCSGGPPQIPRRGLSHSIGPVHSWRMM